MSNSQAATRRWNGRFTLITLLVLAAVAVGVGLGWKGQLAAATVPPALSVRTPVAPGPAPAPRAAAPRSVGAPTAGGQDQVREFVMHKANAGRHLLTTDCVQQKLISPFAFYYQPGPAWRAAQETCSAGFQAAFEMAQLAGYCAALRAQAGPRPAHCQVTDAELPTHWPDLQRDQRNTYRITLLAAMAGVPHAREAVVKNFEIYSDSALSPFAEPTDQGTFVVSEASRRVLDDCCAE